MQACVCLLSMSYAWVLWFVGRPMFTKMKPSNKLILCVSRIPGLYQHIIYAEAVACKTLTSLLYCHPLLTQYPS